MQRVANGHREFIAGERPGLVRAEDVHSRRFIQRGEPRWQDATPRHRPGADCRREREHRGQRHGNRRQHRDQHQWRDLLKWHGQMRGIDGQQDRNASIEKGEIAHHPENSFLFRALHMGCAYEFGAPAELGARPGGDDLRDRLAAAN